MIRLTRAYHFSASHRLHLDSLSEEENFELFGKCNNPFGHGHNYRLEITVEGQVDSASGRVVDPIALDRLVHRSVVADYDHRYLNEDVPEYRALNPTTENIVSSIQRRLDAHWPGDFPRLAHVRVQETKRNVIEMSFR